MVVERAVRVLVVAAKNTFVAELGLYLTLEGNRITLVPHCDAALALAQINTFDVALVCFDKVTANATEMVRKVQATCHNTPMLVLNAPKGSMLPTSANTLVGSPITHSKVLARLHALVRRKQGYSEPILRAGTVQLNQGTQDVIVNGTEIELTPREFSLLELLMMHTETPLTKEAILAHLYGGIDVPSPKIIDVLVCKLRRKLAQAGAAGAINTIYSCGYMISAASRTNVGQSPTSTPRLLST